MDEPRLTTRRLDTPAKPGSFDDKTRSVRVIAATERPIRMRDPEYDIFIDMIILCQRCHCCRHQGRVRC